MAYTPQSGHVGPGVFWQSGRFTIYRHCDRVFDLLVDGEKSLPTGTFEQINFYLWQEWDFAHSWSAA